MGHQGKAIGLSIFLHSILAVATVIWGRHLFIVTRPVIIDFAVETAAAITEKEDEPARTTPETKKQETAPTAISPPAPPGALHRTTADTINDRNAVRHPKTAHRKSLSGEPGQKSATGTTAAIITERAEEREHLSSDSQDMTNTPTTLTAAPSDDTGDNDSIQQGANRGPEEDEIRGRQHVTANTAAGGSGKDKDEYLQNNFEYIRDLVMRNLSFPAAARKLGWSGKILISFVIVEDGNVEDITILSSSGHEVLDHNVVSVIRRTAPFPKPAIKAQLILPIAYNLK